MKRALLLLPLLACSARSTERDAPEPPPSAVAVSGKGSALPISGASTAPASGPAVASSSPRLASSAPAAPAAPALSAGRPLHLETQEDLLALMPIRAYTEKEIKRKGDPLEFLKKNVGPDSPARMNQGNKAIATHNTTREQCLEGLKDIVLQTEEQRRICGADYMVPVYKKGDIKKTHHCIDIFEFPNRPCELPFVWAGPTQASIYCEMQGKRLCSQEEWVQACKGDPEGKEDWLYSYGNELDLTACNTNKPARTYGEPICDPDSVSSTWKTCHSNTEPAGSFPRCRSRFGVFDMQGNVAEAMVRFDPEENALVSQLKGSAFFYVDVARKHNERQKEGGRETYSDHCAHDPRWHVERMSMAWHVNYHLGFRCCKTVKYKDGLAAGRCLYFLRPCTAVSPRISIITPSYQQAAFLEDTLRSVLGQGYDDLEYIVLDGGSRDGSADILRRHGHRLAYWRSEPDGGQAQAVNQGLARATGDILAYLNSDDLYLPGALAHAVERLDPGKAQVLLGNCIQFVEGAAQVYGSDIEGDHARVDLGLRDYVIQPSTFWTRKAWEATGPFDESLGYTFDWDWFYRASKVADFVLTRRHLSMYRLHASHKSGTGGERRAREVLEVIRRHRGERWGRVAEALAAHHRLFRRVDPLLRRARIPQALVPLARALLPRDLRGVSSEGLRDLIGMVA